MDLWHVDFIFTFIFSSNPLYGEKKKKENTNVPIKSTLPVKEPSDYNETTEGRI